MICKKSDVIYGLKEGLPPLGDSEAEPFLMEYITDSIAY
jgi:hypothetical protein